MRRLDRYLDKANNESYLINKGVRTCALLTVVSHKDDGMDVQELLYKLEQLILHHGLNSIPLELQRDEDDDPNARFFEFWIYSYPHQLAVIKAIHDTPRSFLREWVVGKLLGYSDMSMEEYLSHDVMSGLEVDKRILEKED